MYRDIRSLVQCALFHVYPCFRTMAVTLTGREEDIPLGRETRGFPWNTAKNHVTCLLVRDAWTTLRSKRVCHMKLPHRTGDVEQSPCWEDDSRSPSQEIIYRLWKGPKVLYFIHKSQPLSCILIHLHPVHILTSPSLSICLLSSRYPTEVV
jgi:hypothetical protein